MAMILIVSCQKEESKVQQPEKPGQVVAFEELNENLNSFSTIYFKDIKQEQATRAGFWRKLWSANKRVLLSAEKESIIIEQYLIYK